MEKIYLDHESDLYAAESLFFLSRMGQKLDPSDVDSLEKDLERLRKKLWGQREETLSSPCVGHKLKEMRGVMELCPGGRYEIRLQSDVSISEASSQNYKRTVVVHRL